MTIINTTNGGGAKTIAGEEKPSSFPSTYPAPEGYDGWSKLTINAPDNLTAENIAVGKTIAGVTGWYRGQAREFSLADMFISGSEQITYSSPTGISELTLIKDPNLKAENIKKGVDIDGFTGTYEPSLTTEEGTITEFPMTYTTPEGYDGMSTVIAHAPETLVAGNIKKGVEVANITGTYEPALQMKGTKATSFPVVVEPDSDYYGLEQATVTAPENLSAENIRDGITIAGIEGTYETPTQEKTLKPESFPTDVTPDAGYALSKVSVTTPDNLSAENIKKDVTIAGVTGTYEGSGGTNEQFVKLCQRTITEVTADDLAGATKLENYCFYYCSNLTSITIPDGVTSMGENCFCYCSSLISINIPDGVTSIGGYCFRNCSSLTSISIPDSVTSLGNNCFRSCSSLTSITITDGVTSLGSNCFYSCTSLASVTMLPTAPPTLGSNAFTSTSADLVITVPKGCLDAYKAATNWSAYADKMVEASE